MRNIELEYLTAAAGPRANQSCCRAARQRRPAELKEPDYQVERRPESWPGLEAHDSAVDRLAGIEGVSNRLEVEDYLQSDRGCYD